MKQKEELILKILIILLLIFSIFDCISTLGLIYFDFTTEANPIMDYILQYGPTAFILVKMGISLLSCILLWLSRSSHLSVTVSACLVGIMGSVVFIQILMIIQIFI